MFLRPLQFSLLCTHTIFNVGLIVNMIVHKTSVCSSYEMDWRKVVLSCPTYNMNVHIYLESGGMNLDHLLVAMAYRILQRGTLHEKDLTFFC